MSVCINVCKDGSSLFFLNQQSLFRTSELDNSVIILIMLTYKTLRVLRSTHISEHFDYCHLSRLLSGKDNINSSNTKKWSALQSNSNKSLIILQRIGWGCQSDLKQQKKIKISMLMWQIAKIVPK